MEYSIFRNNLLVASVKPLDSSSLSQKKQQEDIVRLDFVLVEFVEIKIGDYIKFEKNDELYYILKNPRVTESPKAYKYSCIFEGGMHLFSRTKVFLDTPKSNGFYRDYEFPLSGNAETFLSFIVDNLNRNGGDYIKGDFKTTNTQLVEFNNWNVFEAITELSIKLNFEWHLDGKKLNFSAPEKEKAYVLHVGRNVGFSELLRTRVNRGKVETVVYGFGSTENMPPRSASTGQTYDSLNLTSNRLAFTGEDGLSKISNNVDRYGSIESIQVFDNIKPEFTGVISAVSSQVNVFYDNSIDFDINDQLLPEIKPKITFLTGKLIGLTFNISFLNSSKQITMDSYSDESGVYPNDLIFASVGDQYKLFDVIMPDNYIEDASNRLQEATQEYLDLHSKPLDSFTAKLDKGFVEANNLVLNIGDLVRIISKPFAIDGLFEIKELTQKITNTNDYTLSFGDILPISLINSFKYSNFSTSNNMTNVQRTSVTNTQVTNIAGEEIEWQTW